MWLRLLESIHGHVAILACAVLIHPAVLLRRGRPLTRGTKLSVILSGVVTSLAFGLGIALYEDYRTIVRRRLFERAPEVGALFETKEHLAWAVLCLALGATVAALLAPREAKRIRQSAAVAYGIAAILAIVVAGLGTYVASVASFPE